MSESAYALGVALITLVLVSVVVPLGVVLLVRLFQDNAS